MGSRSPFQIDPRWTFNELIQNLYAYYTGGGIESTGRRLSVIRTWMGMVGRTKSIEALEQLESESGTSDLAEIAKSLWMSLSTYKALRRYARMLPDLESNPALHPVKAFVSYKWESGEHVAWVRKLAADLRSRGIDALLDQWEVRYGESFTDYMTRHIAGADVILFVITSESVRSAEAPVGKGGALKFEVQMMNARRMADGVRIIGIYRSGDRPPHYLRDHRYVDFRNDAQYESVLQSLVEDLLGNAGPPAILG